MIEEFAADGVEFAQIAAENRSGRGRPGSQVRPDFLQHVVEVRQVDQRQCRVELTIDVNCRLGDPVRRADVGRRSPEVEQRELSELALQFVAQARWVGPDVGKFAAVGGVHRPRGDGVIRRRVHRVPPEAVGAGEAGMRGLGDVPEFRALHEPVALPPELHLALVAEVPAVGDRAVLGRPGAGEVGRLYGGGDGGQDVADRRHRAGVDECLEPRRMLADERRRESDRVEDNRFLKGGQSQLRETKGSSVEDERSLVFASCPHGLESRVTDSSTVPLSPRRARRSARRGSPSPAPSSAAGPAWGLCSGTHSGRLAT